MKNKNRVYGFMISILLLSGSCSKSKNDIAAEGVATIQVGLAESEFEGVENVNFASMQRESLVQEDQHTYVPIGDGYSLSVVLSEDNPLSQSNQNRQTNTIVKKAVAERTPLGNNIRYKLVVFRSSGEYVLERDYRRGQETTAAPLLLDGGVTYTFVAYSISSTTDLPAIVFSNPANRTLATSSIQDVSVGDTNYLMHYRANVTPEGGRTTNLAVILRHKLAQVNATIDASTLGLNITALDAFFNSHYPTVTMTLAGVASWTGTVTFVNFTFPILDDQVVDAVPRLINTTASNRLFVIRNITIGTISRSNIRIEGLVIQQGKKYNLTIKVNPTDIFFTDETTGIPVARIAGRVWARHNLGVNTAINPDNTNDNRPDLVGNYYQWGVRAPVANATTEAGVIPNWNANVTNANNSWNTGTEAVPLRNATNDPCPAGFRIPTATEFSNLISSTRQFNGFPEEFGGNNPTNFRPFKLFRSLVNNNVYLTFPMAGYRNASNGGLTSRGSRGAYWASTIASNPVSISNLFMTDGTIVDLGSVTNRSFGNNIRCVRVVN